MTSSEIRRLFLEYFRDKGHTIVPSSSLIPINDPTLLFTNAGMVQFKDVFLGLEKRPYSRATTSQKCMRAGGKHNDLENVGPSPRHHTFFEMLGNFSFGNYFKREAIGFAWELVTKVLGIPAEKLWATVYLHDDEAFQLWQEIAGLPAERIARLGEKSNFWSMGETGPCGPCSEIILDRGLEYGCGRPTCDVNCDCDRWWELWNLVFMQFNQDASGAREPLPRPSIDTGMGLERITAVMQGVDSNYDTDLFRPIIHRTQEMLGDSDEEVEAQIFSYRVVADHSRAVAFLIGDGVIPGNEGRNYVLRRILRRAVRHGRKLGFEKPFLGQTADVVIEIMGEVYPELVQRRDFILRVINHEEENFQKTLSVGLNRFDASVEEILAARRDVIPGEEVFRLYDTYGFPPDLTAELAQERGLRLDMVGFDKAMAEQRYMSHVSQQFRGRAPEAVEAYIHLRDNPNAFIGYHKLEAEAKVVGLLRGGEPAQEVVVGDSVEIALDATPFYPEGGGQVGDTGTIRSEGGEVRVSDTYSPVPGVIIHEGVVLSGKIELGEIAVASVDRATRLDTMRNHTATHLLHKALRETLGEHAQQAGSLVSPERLRFDFSHLSALTPEELETIQRRVNEKIRANLPVHTTITAYDAALEQGAIALFGEKYGTEVRMVTLDEYSRELCGGTHVSASGEIGIFYITGESSIGSGLRRIEALTGRAAETYLEERAQEVGQLASLLRVTPADVPVQVRGLLEKIREQEREIKESQRRLALAEVDELLGQVLRVDGTQVLAATAEAPNVAVLREMGDHLRNRLHSGVIVLGSVIDGKPSFVAIVTPDVVKAGIRADRLVREVAAVVGGGGGGRPELAQAGGRDPEKMDEALARVPELVRHG